MNALVTGAGGFLGRYIVERLVARNDRVRAFCRKQYEALDALGVETVRGDLRDRAAIVAACRGMDAVFHVGGIVGMGGAWREFYQINTLGTQHVVEGCRKHGVPRLVFTSSPSVTFDGTSQEGVDESAPYPRRWLAPYPWSKALAERHVLEAADIDGLATCALRPHLIWGERDPHLIPSLLAKARAGKLRRIGDGANRIDTVHVENAAAAHLLATDALLPGSPVTGRAYFISQGEPVNCWQWIDQVLAMAGLPPIRKSLSFPAAWMLGAVIERVHRLMRLKGEPWMTRFLAAQLSMSHYYDISRARRDFGYGPEVSTEEGMRRLAQQLAGYGQGKWRGARTD